MQIKKNHRDVSYLALSLALKQGLVETWKRPIRIEHHLLYFPLIT